MSRTAERAVRLTRAMTAGPSPLLTRRLLRAADTSLRAEGLAPTRARLSGMATDVVRGAKAVPLVDHVAVVARSMRPAPTCLRQALVVEALLTSSGVAAAAQIGVRRDPITRAWESHAWVAIDGEPIIDRDRVLDSYRTLDIDSPGVGR